MSQLDLKPFEELYPQIVYYTPFVEDVFRYLNGYINPYNPCRLHIKLYSAINYAEYAKPDIAIVYLGSIINNCWGDDNLIKTVIIMTLAHELSHSWQNTDMIRYTYDPYYKKEIEDQNEGRTERWIIDHSDEIYSRFGVRIEYSDWAINSVMPNAEYYQHNNPGDYFLHTILDVAYRNKNYIDPLTKLFNSEESIIFRIDDSPKVLLKYKGEYNINAIPAFNRLINQYCRIGIAAGYFTISVEIMDVSIFDTKGIDLHMHISNKFYEPIIIPKSNDSND